MNYENQITTYVNMMNESHIKNKEMCENHRIFTKNVYLTKILEQKNDFNLDYVHIDHNDKKYVVFKLKTNFIHCNLCVVDFDDFNKIKNLKWDCVNGYAASELKIKGNKCYKSIATLYLHNFVMGKLTFEGKGQTTTIDHINRNPIDNRKENLHLINQSEQNLNQNKKQRQLILPEHSHIKINDIPRGVSYVPVFKNHGNGFEVNLPQFNNAILKYYSSRDKTLSLKFKLEQVKKFLRYTKSKFPEEFAKHHIETEYNQNEIDLIDSYNEIIKLSEFPEYKNNLITYNTQNYLTEDLTYLTDNEKKLLDTIQFENKTKKKLLTVLPDGCDITVNMIPKYCYYAKPTCGIGDKFVIDKHPKLNGKSWSTQTSKKLTINDKFDQLLKKLKELEQI